jgi:hypothetical protein
MRLSRHAARRGAAPRSCRDGRTGQFHDFHAHGPVVVPNKEHPLLLQLGYVGGIDLVPVAVPLVDRVDVAIQLAYAWCPRPRPRPCHMSRAGHRPKERGRRGAHARVTQSGLTNTVARVPRRIVPPKWVTEISGMLITTGCGVPGTISVECASASTCAHTGSAPMAGGARSHDALPCSPSTLRANSTTAICRPRQMPMGGVSHRPTAWPLHP